MVFERYIAGYTRAFAKTDRNMWNYEDGCVLIGLTALYGATGDERLLQAVKTFIDRYVNAAGEIRLYQKEEYNLDFIPSGRALFTLYRITGEERYRKVIEQLMEQLRSQPRTRSGSFWHKRIYPNQVWLDGLYMAMPFYTLYENSFGNGAGYADVLSQFETVRRRLFDPQTRLHYHAWDESRTAFWADPATGLSQNFWSRAIGWHLMALADVYECWPADVPGRERLAELWAEAVDGALPYRDTKTGLFYQLAALADAKGNYLETSASLMAAYSLYKGVRLGVFQSDEYLSAAEEILCAVETRQMAMENGTLHLGGICKGAGLGPEGNNRRDGSAAYYVSEKTVDDEQKGVGVLMMACAERQLLAKRQPIESSLPRVEVFTMPYDPIMPDEILRLRGQNAGA